VASVFRTEEKLMPAPPYEQEYSQVNDNIRALADIRFKLLALIPPLGGVAIFLLSQAAITRTDDPPAAQANPPGPNDFALVLLLSLMGFLATLGVTFYDQRNSEIYNALIGRARELERRMKLSGGQYLTRPARSRHFLGVLLMWHDLGLSLIYGTVLGAWFFPAVYSASWLLNSRWKASFIYPLLASLIMALVFIAELLRQDGAWRDLWARVRRSLTPHSISGAELTLLMNLGKIREAMKRYRAENSAPLTDLMTLVGRGYLKKLPPDPIAENRPWALKFEKVPQILNRPREIVDVHSDSAEQSSTNLWWYTHKTGEPYNKW
jgi:hypothetical protein